MGSEEFLSLCKNVVADYFNRNVDKTDGEKITQDDIFIYNTCITN